MKGNVIFNRNAWILSQQLIENAVFTSFDCIKLPFNTEKKKKGKCEKRKVRKK
jgi:hypothetical protein